MPRLGAHLSAAGGVSRAASAAVRLGCGSLQVFLRAPGRWAAAPLADAEVVAFRTAAGAAALRGACFAHAPYLLNLAAANETLRARSIETLADELQRGGRLGLAGLVLHPGSAGSGDRAEAEQRCRAAISEALDRAGSGACRLLLEGTAGMGGQLGVTPAELARLVPAGARARVGVCLDLAHLWGAGYDLVSEAWDRVAAELEAAWGSPSPDLLHGNDTPVARGSRRDRHTTPGDGVLGEDCFRRLLADRRLSATPLVIEIPPGDGNENIVAALARLRSWSPG